MGKNQLRLEAQTESLCNGKRKEKRKRKEKGKKHYFNGKFNKIFTWLDSKNF